MKTSVVLAVYNGEKFLNEQLESIAGQTMAPDEILIGEDGSSDGSMKILQDFLHAHPKLNIKICHWSSNKGYKENFHLLLEKAQGDYIFLCDQDDRWHKTKMEEMVNIAKNHPEILCLSSSFHFMDANSNAYDIPLKKGWSNQNLYQKEAAPDSLEPADFDGLAYHNYFQGCSMMISKELRNLYLQRYTDWLPHDWLLALLAASREGLYFYNRPLFDYRIHQNNTTGLTQGKKTGLAVKFRQANSEYYRTVVKKDSVEVLKTIRSILPEMWNDQREDTLIFFEQLLSAIQNGSVMTILKLYHHPAYLRHTSKTGRLSDLFYVIGHPKLIKKNR